MKKILLSLSMIAVVGVLVLGATGAFFSDTETSTGNTFTAGAIDLKIDSKATYNNELVSNATWELKDLAPTADKFFNFTDIKPGDSGENTISLHVINNDAWACVDISPLTDLDNTTTEPESLVDTDLLATGELAEETNFFAWAETDGDNIFEGSNGQEYPLFSNIVGPASDVINGKTYALADSVTNGGVVMTGGQTKYIGLAWCAGTLTTDVVNGGWACDGSAMGNESQTDSFSADISFRVEQSRNNENFRCDGLTLN